MLLLSRRVVSLALSKFEAHFWHSQFQLTSGIAPRVAGHLGGIEEGEEE